MWDWVLGFLGEWGAELGGGAALLAIVETVFKPFRRMFGRTETVKLDNETTQALVPPRAKDGPALTVPEFIRLRRELKADLEQELAEAAEGEKAQLTARIAELESQIANPDKALEEANKRIADLEALLDRAGNEIGGDRIKEAKAALEQGDYSVADEIFAEIEARNTLAVQETARAAFGRGEVAEAEIRWHDAYTHYKRAVDLNDTVDHLAAYAQMCWRLAKGAEVVAVQERLVAIVKKDYGEDSIEYAAQLNNFAEAVRAQGRYETAEKLYRQALEIARAMIGEEHPNYASGLNNLAGVVEAQERYKEAEGLYRQALEIDRATLGERHSGYAIDLNNLAGVVQAQGRNEEAEGLYRQALETDRATLGEGHPDYAIVLSNLGQLLGQTGRTEDAREMLAQSLAIFRDTLPPDHPYIGEVERHLADLPEG